MLIRLSSKHIQDHWDEIKEGIRSSLPPIARSDDDGMVTVLASLLSGSLQGWVVVDDSSPDQPILAILTTAILNEFGSGARFLLVYSLCGYAPLLAPIWKDLLRSLGEFAKEERCQKIIAYTVHKGLFEILSKHVPDAEEQHCLIVPVGT